MRVNYFRPSLDLVVDEAAKQLILTDAETGFEMRGNFDDVARDGIAPHCTQVTQRASGDVPIATALEFEKRRSRLNGNATPLEGTPLTVPAGSANDWHDDAKSSHTTSGARRHFVSVGFERAMRGLPDGLASIRSWASYQHHRPTAWWPFDFSYDGYYGTRRATSSIGKWKYDDRMLDGVRDPNNGWGIFDPAHVETAILFGGAALGDLECLGLLTMGLAPWVLSTFPGGGKAGKVQKGWRGSDQERAVGRMTKAVADFAMLGIGVGEDCEPYRQAFLAGLDPKHHLVGLMKHLLNRPPPLGSGKADERTLVDFRDGSGEVAGYYGWQNGILLHDLHRGAISSSLIGGATKAGIESFLHSRADLMLARCVDARGVSYAASVDEHFTQASDLPVTDPANQSVDKANQLETDHSHRYELVDLDGDGTGSLRDVPRVPDSELMAAGLAVVRGTYDPAVNALLALHPAPDSPKYRGSIGRSLDVVYGLREAR